MDSIAGNNKRHQELLYRSCQGDHEAYGELFMDYYTALVRYAWPMLQVHEDAEDAVHDAFLKSWIRLSRFDGRKGKYSTWIFAITRNCCMDRLRQRKRTITPDPTSEFFENVHEARKTWDPESTAVHSDCQTELFAMVATLAEIYRETIVLHYWNEKSIKEIAAITQTSVSNVKSRLSRGRMQLAEICTQRSAQAYLPDSVRPDLLGDFLGAQMAAS